MARWDALNSTGKVTSWKSTTTAYMMMAAVVSPEICRKIPAISRKIQALEAKFTAGTMAPRIFMGA